MRVTFFCDEKNRILHKVTSMLLQDVTQPRNFCGVVKKTAWQAWEQFLGVTSVFKRRSNPDVCIAVVENKMEILEVCTVSLYSKKLETKCVNEVRELLFSQGKRSIENLPPTKMLWFSMY